MKKLNFAFQIAQVALSLLRAAGGQKLQQGATKADILLQIIQTSVQAHQDLTGQPFDLSMIQPEQPA